MKTSVSPSRETPMEAVAQAQLSPKSSEKINLIRYPLIIGVLLVHGYSIPDSSFFGPEVQISAGFFPELFQGLISKVIGSLAVPLFYLMSGFLFFYKFQLSAPSYFAKLKSRARSLLIPYLFWNTVIFSLFLSLEMIPGLSQFIMGNRKPILESSVFENLNTLLGFDKYPIAYQFWFIRDLMVIVLFSPLIALALRYAKWATLAVLFAIWAFRTPFLDIPDRRCVFFFYLVALLSQYPYLLDRLSGTWKTLLMWGYPLLALTNAYFQFWVNYNILDNLSILIGILAIWIYLDRVMQSPWWNNWLQFLAPAAFFLFASHEPFQLVIKRLMLLIAAPDNPWVHTLGFLANTLIVATLCTTAYFLLNKFVPKFTSLVTGGR